MTTNSGLSDRRGERGSSNVVNLCHRALLLWYVPNYVRVPVNRQPRKSRPFPESRGGARVFARGVVTAN